MKDERLYAKLTLDFPDDPKIQPLSSDAFRCLVEAICWSRKHLTDGWLSKRLALARWSLETLRELSTNDDDHPSLLESEHGWMIRDFAEHQDTKADIKARRERYVTAGRKGGQASAKARAQAKVKRTVKRKLNDFQAETETVLLAPNRASVLAADGRERANGAPARSDRPVRRNPDDPELYYDERRNPDGTIRKETFEESLDRAERESREIF